MYTVQKYTISAVHIYSAVSGGGSSSGMVIHSIGEMMSFPSCPQKYTVVSGNSVFDLYSIY